MMKFICYPKCTTCQKAKKWLNVGHTENLRETGKDPLTPKISAGAKNVRGSPLSQRDRPSW